MTSISTDAREEVEELHDYVEQIQEENRKWRLVSLSLGALSVVLGGLSVVLTTI